jgi:hypothetical protein
MSPPLIVRDEAAFAHFEGFDWPVCLPSIPPDGRLIFFGKSISI